MTPSTMEWTRSFKKIIYPLLPPVFWLGVWQVAAFLVEWSVQGRGNQLLLPYPAAVLAALIALGGESSFWRSVLLSLGRILWGMALGTVAGAALAVLTCSFEWCHRLLAPAIRVVRATPVASFILLVLLWTERGFVPAIIAALMVLPVVWVNLAHGIQAADPQLLELAGAYGYSPRKQLQLIYLPTLRPYFRTCITTAMGLAWKSGVAAEVLCLPPSAVGTQIYNAKLYLEIPQLFAWTLVVVTLSLLLERLLHLALDAEGAGARG